MATMSGAPRYRLDFIVPESYDISEDPVQHDLVTGAPARNPTLERLRAAMSSDHRWQRSILAPWKPGTQQHLIVWVDLDQETAEAVIGDGVYDVVSEVLPGVMLLGIVQTPV
jgi:hypothetical protein